MRRVLLLLLVSAAACGTTDDADPPTYGAGVGTPGNPAPQDGVPYAVHTQFEPGATLPASVTQMTASLRELAQTPGHALLDLAAGASPAELAVINSLPSALRSRLEGWIDTEIDKVPVDGKRARVVAGEAADFAETALTRFSLESTLTFSPAVTKHTLGALSFRLAGFDIVVPVGGLAADKIDQKVSVTIGAGGAVAFAEHGFGIAFGAHAWHGIELASESELGTDLSSALGSAVNCRALSQAVAAKCYGSSCVGHAAELQALCEHDLGSVLGDLQSDIANVDIDAIHFTGGMAHLADDNGDGFANRIENGAWSPDASFGADRATFTGIAPGR